jgi:glucose-6-phosphate 1-dehydrogenase
MEPPTSFAPEDLQAARESVISAFRPLDPADVVLGQFDGYRQTEGIADDSTTDTYVAAKLWVDTDRWRDVPFVLRTGKRLQGGAQRISLLFRAPEGPLHSAGTRPEVLAFDLEGSGRILMELTVKDPGPDFVPSEVSHVLRLDQVAEGSMAPYTALIHDVLRGDRSLFTSSVGLAAAFTAFAPLLGPDRPEVVSYPEGSWGPAAADRLTGRFGWLLARE